MRGPRRHHDKQHRDRTALGETFDNCWTCGRDRAICRTKIALHTFAEAWDWMLDYNIEHNWNPSVWYYRCRWCPGFHLKSAKDPITRWRVERVRRKWLIAGRTPPPAPVIREGVDPT